MFSNVLDKQKVGSVSRPTKERRNGCRCWRRRHGVVPASAVARRSAGVESTGRARRSEVTEDGKQHQHHNGCHATASGKPREWPAERRDTTGGEAYQTGTICQARADRTRRAPQRRHGSVHLSDASPLAAPLGHVLRQDGSPRRNALPKGLHQAVLPRAACDVRRHRRLVPALRLRPRLL